MIPKPVLLAVAVGAILIPSCSDEGTEATPEPTSTSVVGPSPDEPTDEAGSGDLAEEDYARALVDAGEGFDGFMTEDEGLCFMTAFVSGIGFDRVLETGLDPEEFAAEGEEALGLDDAESRDLLIDGLVDCVDLHELLIDATGMDDDLASCLREDVEEVWLAEALMGVTDDGDPSTPDPTFSEKTEAAVDAAHAACPEAMAALG